MTERKVLQRINSGDPVVVSGNFSTLSMCMCRIWGGSRSKKKKENNEVSLVKYLNKIKMY